MVPKKLLLAEDDEDDQRLFFDFLHHRTDIRLMPVTENGEDLLRVLQQISETHHLPDLIILDQNMPKINGIQTLQLLKESERYQNIPVIIYSTYLDKQLVKESLEAGASAVLPKPVSKQGYEEMIDTLLYEILKVT